MCLLNTHMQVLNDELLEAGQYCETHLETQYKDQCQQDNLYIEIRKYLTL